MRIPLRLEYLGFRNVPSPDSSVRLITRNVAIWRPIPAPTHPSGCSTASRSFCRPIVRVTDSDHWLGDGAHLPRRWKRSPRHSGEVELSSESCGAVLCAPFLKVGVLMRRRGRLAEAAPRRAPVRRPAVRRSCSGHHRIPTRTYSALPGRRPAARKVSSAVRSFCSAALVSSAVTAGSPSLLRLSPDVVLTVGLAGVGRGQQLGDAG